ncbi:MAG: HlyD family efflux transporter periplasmic adaptor subunit [Waterburya sp.]
MQNIDRHILTITLPRLSRTTWLGIAATLISGGIFVYGFFRFLDQSPTQPIRPTLNQTTQPVTALGYLEPAQDGVIQVTAPSTANRAIINQLLVKEGDRIQSGQVIGILSTRNTQQAAVTTAKTEVRVAQAQLAQVQAGAKPGDIQAQIAVVTSAESQLTNAQTEAKRYEFLYQQGAVSEEDRDSRRLQLQTAEANLRQQQEKLNSVAQVRSEDVQTAETQLANAIAQLNEAKTNLELTYVRAPRTGEIIRINTYPGELIGDNGILDLGQTKQMYVSAEVYQSDISRVQVGQQARITGDAFKGTLLGIVSKIGREVRGQNLQDTDPLADVDARVIEVKIRLNPVDSQKVAGFTNLQVKVAINP